MELSSEDNLRLNVLLAQNLKAVRIDESKLIVYALTQKGDLKIQLNPTCKDEKYVKLVKELLSNKIMGSPGGYPVYIKRWTRMGQDRQEESLAQLLCLGEEEAVVAVVHAPKLTPEIATHAWWAYPSAENARRLLDKAEIAECGLARELAEFLLEFLPFEEEHRNMIESVRLCLQPGLLSTEEIEDLWKKSRRKQSYYVGFLHSLPDALPEQPAAHPQATTLSQLIQDHALQNNAYAQQLQRYFSSSGQAFLKTLLQVIEKAASQDTIVALFEALTRYHVQLPLAQLKQRSIADAQTSASLWINSSEDPQLAEVLQALPQYREAIRSMLVLVQMGEVTLFPIFGLTDAIGSVMRKQLKPLTDPLKQQVQMLLG